MCVDACMRERERERERERVGVRQTRTQAERGDTSGQASLSLSRPDGSRRSVV